MFIGHMIQIISIMILTCFNILILIKSTHLFQCAIMKCATTVMFKVQYTLLVCWVTTENRLHKCFVLFSFASVIKFLFLFKWSSCTNIYFLSLVLSVPQSLIHDNQISWFQSMVNVSKYPIRKPFTTEAMKPGSVAYLILKWLGLNRSCHWTWYVLHLLLPTLQSEHRSSQEDGSG